MNRRIPSLSSSALFSVTLAILASQVVGCSSNRASTAAVEIDTFAFRPVELRIAKGTTVTWTNADDIEHTVTAGTRTYAPGNSGLVVATERVGTFDDVLAGRGATASVRFGQAGSFHYFCDRHPGMEADVVVT